MHTYAKLKDGRLMKIYGEDSKNETYILYPDSYEYGTKENCEQYSYNDVVRVDSNRYIADGDI